MGNPKGGSDRGPYTIKIKGNNPLKLWCITMIDQAARWFEMKETQNKEARTTANIVEEQKWLTRYTIPQVITYDCGTEFMVDFDQIF